MTAWTGFLDSADPDVGPSDDARVGARWLTDTALGEAPADVALRVLVSGGAGQLAGPVGLCGRRGLRLVALETTVRDLDDPAGNVRRVVAAADDAGLPDDAVLHVGLGPHADGPGHAWLAALDEVAAGEHALTLDPGGPGTERWIDAALDRELPFSLRGGSVEDAVAAVRTTARLWGDADDLTAARRWCRSWSCPAGADVRAAVAYLVAQ